GQVSGFAFLDIDAIALAVRFTASNLVHEHVRVGERGTQLQPAGQEEVEPTTDLHRRTRTSLFVTRVGNGFVERGAERAATDAELHVRTEAALFGKVDAPEEPEPYGARSPLLALQSVRRLVVEPGQREASTPREVWRHAPESAKTDRATSLHARATIVAVAS